MPACSLRYHLSTYERESGNHVFENEARAVCNAAAARRADIMTAELFRDDNVDKYACRIWEGSALERGAGNQSREIVSYSAQQLFSSITYQIENQLPWRNIVFGYHVA